MEINMEAEQQHLQQTLNNDIPLTSAIGIQVVEFTGSSLTLSAPLANNTNHKRTAFGGSLYSVAVLAGWGLLYLRLRALGLAGNIVIQESHVRYIHPVADDIIVTCNIESEAYFQKFINFFNRKDIARISLVSLVTQNSDIALEFEGNYVVHT